MDKKNIGILINEMKKFISEDEMKKFKSNEEHEKYYKEAIEKIGSKEEYIKISRITKKPTKFFYEEYAVIIDYVNIKYKNKNDIVWKWCGGEGKSPEPKLTYDGIIMQNDIIKEKIEVTCPLHCEEDVIAAASLNETGFYCYEPVSVEEYELNCKFKIKDVVEKKNKKRTYDGSITLIVVFDDYHFLPSSKLMDKNFLNWMFDDIKKINYVFKNVYVLMDKYDGSELKYDPYLIKIK